MPRLRTSPTVPGAMPGRPEPARAAEARAIIDPRGRPWMLILLALLVLALGVATVWLGSVSIELRQLLAALGPDAPATSATAIVRTIRLPRAVTALLAGAALGVSGLQMQTLFRNPLADPFILGIASGASLGVAVVVLGAGTFGTALVAGLGLVGNVSVAVAAALGATMITLLVLAVSRRVANPATVLIVGLMVGYAVTALVSVLIHSGFGQLERIRAYIAWGFGSFAGTTWDELLVLAPAVVIALLVAGATVKPLNAMLLGDRYATSMGLDVPRTRVVTIVSASVLAGTVTAFCGPIAFVGVAVPHMARALLATSDHRLLVPGTILLGAAIALVAGLVAQLPGQDASLPLNAVTSLIGAPVVVVVLLRMRHASQAVST